MAQIGVAFQALGPLIVLALALRPQPHENNWFRLGLGVAGLSGAFSALDLFPSAAQASSAQWMLLICCVLGALGGVLLLLRVRPGQWRIAGAHPDSATRADVAP